MFTHCRITVNPVFFLMYGGGREFLCAVTKRWLISVPALPRLPTLHCSRSLSMVEMHGHDTKTNCITSSRPADHKNTHLPKTGGALTEQSLEGGALVCVCVNFNLYMETDTNYRSLKRVCLEWNEWGERAARKHKFKGCNFMVQFGHQSNPVEKGFVKIKSNEMKGCN